MFKPSSHYVHTSFPRSGDDARRLEHDKERNFVLTRPSPATIARHPLAIVAAFAAMLTFALLLAPSAALAGASGQLGKWDPTVGAGEEEVFNGRPMGVDSADGSVFIGSFNENLTEMVFQKFSKTGNFEGAVTLPTLSYVGIAVDSVNHRFYVLKDEGGAKEVTKILAFSTIPNASGELVPAPEKELPVPTGAAALFQPQELVIDPSTGNLIVLAKNEEELTVLQRIDVDPVTGAGTVSESFVDSAEVIRPRRGIAVDAEGLVYILSFVPGGGEPLIAESLPADFTASSSPTPVPGFEEAVPLEEFRIRTAAAFNFGPQVAVASSPIGGDTIFWKAEENNTGEPELYIHNYSVKGEATAAVFGGGAEEECRIATETTSLAAEDDGSLVAFDQGTAISTPGQEPAHFPIVYTFGPGGSGCPAPAPAFKLESGGQGVTAVPTGSTVTFNGAESELNGATLEKTVWKVEGPEEFSEVVAGPAQTFSHPLTAVGKYIVRMVIEAPTLNFGSVFSAQPRMLEVTAGEPTKFALDLSTSGTGTGSFKCKVDGGAEEACAAEYESGEEVEVVPNAAAGSKFAKWTGDCTGTGACVLTMDAAHSVVGEFKTESTPPAEFTLTITPPSNGSIKCDSGAGAGSCAAKYTKGAVVTLTETPASGFEFAGWTGDCSGTGACSVTMDAAHTVGATFKAVSSGGGGDGDNGGGGGTSNPPSGGGTPPPPPGGGGTPHKSPAQILREKRQKAIAKCKKLNGKAEAKCLKKARQIGKPKKKAKGKARVSARVVGLETW